jgi:hypothetical protein
MASLVAAALVVVFMAGLVVGGRLWRDSYSSGVYRHPINQLELKKLEARPLQLPAVAAGAECPVGPYSDGAYGHMRSQSSQTVFSGPALMFGDGPLYMAGARTPQFTAWGTWVTTYVLLDPAAAGPVLLRATDLRTGTTLVFSEHSGMAVPAGDRPVTDSAAGDTWHGFTELVLNPSQPDLPDPGELKDSREWPGWWVYLGYPKAASSCVGFQVDGAGFTETYVMSV